MYDVKVLPVSSYFIAKFVHPDEVREVISLTVI
jgi:hypothetical protein